MFMSDLPSLLDTTLNHWWLLASAVIAIIAVIGLIVTVIKDLGVPTAFLFTASVIVTFGTWAYGAFNINEDEQNTALHTWISETYGIDEDLTGGNLAREVIKQQGQAPTIIDDQGRVLSVVTTVEGRLALVDAGGRELPHADSE